MVLMPEKTDFKTQVIKNAEEKNRSTDEKP